ncbi:LysR family transcriptional regulator (plasmid) [Paracoccus methylovorus]|uniref:LysR family transcriptional regulator n=2 Tax=Paracoccus TaxID=265 RepID=A0ABX7JQB5_9RHOB|nr:LysR substrate-binding domain-containing protein [Paracoccus methylovorus]QRZ16054.1 LysR family transcriptional regulator [Paracoccus methylovorus]
MNKLDIRQFNLRTLRYFLVLSEELHFSRAAKRLNMSQPPLSQQIRQLEESLGFALFSRGRHNVELTPAGHVFREQVPAIFGQLEKAVTIARQTAQGEVGRLEIGVISSSLVGVVPIALEKFRERYPDTQWTLHELPPNLQIQGLLEKQIDVCLFRMPPQQEGLHQEKIMEEDLMIALPRAHPLADRPSLALTDLREQPFVMFGLQKSRFADYLYACCVQAGFIPQIRQQVVEVQTLLSLVGANMGVALLPTSMRHIAQRNVIFKSISGARPKIPLHAIYRENDPSPTLGNFLNILKDLVQEDAQTTHVQSSSLS